MMIEEEREEAEPRSERPRHSGGLSAAILVAPYPPTVRVRQGRGGRNEVQSQDDPDLLGQGDPDHEEM